MWFLCDILQWMCKHLLDGPGPCPDHIWLLTCCICRGLLSVGETRELWWWREYNVISAFVIACMLLSYCKNKTKGASTDLIRPLTSHAMSLYEHASQEMLTKKQVLSVIIKSGSCLFPLVWSEHRQPLSSVSWWKRPGQSCELHTSWRTPALLCCSLTSSPVDFQCGEVLLQMSMRAKDKRAKDV